MRPETLRADRLEAGPSASESVSDPRGASPLQAVALRPVTEGNGVAARRGREQPEVNHRSVVIERDSAWRCGEPAGKWRSLKSLVATARPLKGSVSKRAGAAWGGWRRNDGKVGYMNQRDLSGSWAVFMRKAEEPQRAGVRAAIVARKHRNGCGAKGGRKVDA